MATNYRFTAFHSGPVKLTLRPAQTLSHSSFARHEEGWSSERAQYTHDGDYVYREIDTDGRDCDGRMSSHYASRCHRTRLTAHWVGTCKRCQHTVTFTRGDGKLPRCIFCDERSAPVGSIAWEGFYPAWERVERSQRDYSAEAAGY
jgi:hypothetical protein